MKIGYSCKQYWLKWFSLILESIINLNSIVKITFTKILMYFNVSVKKWQFKSCIPPYPILITIYIYIYYKMVYILFLRRPVQSNAISTYLAKKVGGDFKVFCSASLKPHSCIFDNCKFIKIQVLGELLWPVWFFLLYLHACQTGWNQTSRYLDPSYFISGHCYLPFCFDFTELSAMSSSNIPKLVVFAYLICVLWIHTQQWMLWQ